MSTSKKKTSATERICKAHFVPGDKTGCSKCPLYEICWHFDGPPCDVVEVLEEKAQEWLDKKESASADVR